MSMSTDIAYAKQHAESGCTQAEAAYSRVVDGEIPVRPTPAPPTGNADTVNAYWAHYYSKRAEQVSIWCDTRLGELGYPQ